jgi:hypothetical protein
MIHALPLLGIILGSSGASFVTASTVNASFMLARVVMEIVFRKGFIIDAVS